MRGKFVASVSEQNGSIDQGAFYKSMAKAYKDSLAATPKGTKKVSLKRIEILTHRILAPTGPFGKMADDLAKDLKALVDMWARQTALRIHVLFGDMQKALSASLSGKRLTTERRNEIAPDVVKKITEAMNKLEGYLAGYSSDIN